MKRVILTIIMFIPLLGMYAQQRSRNSTNHFQIGINTNFATFNNQNKTMPFSFSISPFATYWHNRFGYTVALGWATFDDQWKTAPECTRYYHWNEINLSGLVSYRIYSDSKRFSLSVFCGPSMDFLADYQVKIVAGDDTFNLDKDEALAGYNFCGIDISAGMTASFNITNKIIAELSPFFKFKVLNEIRDYNHPRLPLLVHPTRFYGVSFSVCYQI